MSKLGEKDQLSLGEDAVNFASDFIRRMREHPAVSLEPSPRQAIAIPSLLSSRRMRKGLLRAEDFLLAAVITSYPENQAIAYRVAMQILYGEQSSKSEEDKPDDTGDRKGSAAQLKIGFLLREGEVASEFRESSGSGVGAGDELFREWCAKFRSDKEYRHRLTDMADRIILTSDSKCEYNFLTKEELGPLEGDKLRYFQLGDDPGLIDFKESVENIISQGKGLSEVRYEDFIVRERGGQRKAVVFLQDISGSMNETLKDTTMCTVLLLYALRKHEIAFAFFESSAYVIKEFFDRKSIDGIIEEILSAESMFGTMGASVLRWGSNQLAKVDGRYYRKVCIIFSDFGFFDTQKVAAEIKMLTDMDVKVVIILPPTFIYKSCLEVVKRTDCTIVELNNITKFPEIISEII